MALSPILKLMILKSVVNFYRQNYHLGYICVCFFLPGLLNTRSAYGQADSLKKYYYRSKQYQGRT